MALLREIVTDWTGPQGSGMQTVMYMLEQTTTHNDQRVETGVFWSGVAAGLSNLYTWKVRELARVIESTDGGLVREDVDTPVVTGPGGSAAQPVADATQALVRWKTGLVVRGRILKGRTYIPGLISTEVLNGNLKASSLANFQARANTLANAAVGFSIWSRPLDGGAGSSALVSSATVWGELAVLRGRRNA